MPYKRIGIAAIGLLVVIWLSGEYLLMRDARLERSERDEALSLPASSSSPIVSPRRAAPSFPPPSGPSSPTLAPVPSESGTTSRLESEVAATLVVPGRTIDLRVPDGANVLELMTLAKERGAVDFESESYLGLGSLIVAIDGKRNDEGGNDMYWILSVNGKKATVGVSSLLVSNGDVVSWTYEKNLYR